MLTSLLYVSTSLIEPERAESRVAEIVRHAELRNAEHGLTGALLFTGSHFAQVFEGEEQDVDALLACLCKDSRHSGLMVVDRRPLAERRFADWRMAYSGPSQFVARQVNRVLNDPSPSEMQRAADWLISLFCEFAGQ